MSERSHRHNPAAHSRSRPTRAKRGGPSLIHRPHPTANFITSVPRQRWVPNCGKQTAAPLSSESEESSYPRKVVAFGQSWICESWTGLYTSSRLRCWRTGAWSNAFSPRIGLQRSTWRTLTFTFRSFRWTKMNDSLLVIRKGAVLANESVMSNFLTPLKYLQNYVWFVGIGQKMPDGGNGDVMSPCHNLEPSLVARDSASSA